MRTLAQFVSAAGPSKENFDFGFSETLQKLRVNFGCSSRNRKKRKYRHRSASKNEQRAAFHPQAGRKLFEKAVVWRIVAWFVAL